MHHVFRTGVCLGKDQEDNSKNCERKTSSEPFIPPHVYHTWHSEQRENIKRIEKSRWLRKHTTIKVMLPRVEGHSGPPYEGH